METVQPIRDKNKIEEIKAILKRNNTRDYLLFVLGINTGLRISDILKLKVSDVKNRTHIEIREEKTNKSKRFFINTCLEKALNEYLTGMNENEYLFKSQKGANKAIERWQAHKIINNAARQAG